MEQAHHGTDRGRVFVSVSGLFFVASNDMFSQQFYVLMVYLLYASFVCACARPFACVLRTYMHASYSQWGKSGKAHNTFASTSGIKQYYPRTHTHTHAHTHTPARTHTHTHTHTPARTHTHTHTHAHTRTRYATMLMFELCLIRRMFSPSWSPRAQR